MKWRVPIVRVEFLDGGHLRRSEEHVFVEADDPVGAWLAAQRLDGAPAESDTLRYGQAVRCRHRVAGAIP